MVLPYQNYITGNGREKSGRREFHYCQYYWKYQGKENTLVSYFTYVGDTINAYIITVTQFLWSIPLCRWLEFIFHMLWDRGNRISKQNTLPCFKSCFLIFLCLVLSIIWPYSTIHTEFSHHLNLRFYSIINQQVNLG